MNLSKITAVAILMVGSITSVNVFANEAKEVSQATKESILRTWKDSGFEESPLPFCSLTGVANNCLAAAEDGAGTKYVGEFKNDRPSGRVVVTYKKGDKYVGDFDNGPNGQGIFYYLVKGSLLADNPYEGWIFVGEFKNGLRKGNGIFFNQKGDVVESGVYDGGRGDNILKEYRYVDPATFNRIPANKIPVISADARALIEKKQAEIAFAAKPKPGQRSVSGKPQDEAYCKMLGDPRITDKKCLPSDPQEFITRKTTFEILYSFFMTGEPNFNAKSCESSDYFKPLLKFLRSNSIQYRLQASNYQCEFEIEFNDLANMCSPEVSGFFFNGYGGFEAGVSLTRIDAKDNFQNRTKIRDIPCKR